MLFRVLNTKLRLQVKIRFAVESDACVATLFIVLVIQMTIWQTQSDFFLFTSEVFQ